MEVTIKDNRFVIIIKPWTIYFGLHKKVDRNMKYGIDFIIKHNEVLAEHTMKNEISWLLSKYEHGSNFREHREQQSEGTTQICS